MTGDRAAPNWLSFAKLLGAAQWRYPTTAVAPTVTTSMATTEGVAFIAAAPPPRNLGRKLCLLTLPWLLPSLLLSIVDLLFDYISIVSMFVVLSNFGAGREGSDHSGGGDVADDGGGALFGTSDVRLVRFAVGGLFLGPFLCAATSALQQHLRHIFFHSLTITLPHTHTHIHTLLTLLTLT